MIDERCSMTESYNTLLKTVLVMMTLKWFQLQFQAHEREEADHEEDMPKLTSRVHMQMCSWKRKQNCLEWNETIQEWFARDDDA
jgi:hypothetical protein